MTNPIADAIVEYKEIIAQLDAAGNVSLSVAAKNIFCKTLILSCASYYETLLTELIIVTAGLESKNSKIIASMIKRKVTDRQYHTYFNWKDAKPASINTFLGLFGDEVKDTFQNKIKNDKELESSVVAFMELGGTRNQLVHLNFATFPLQKTLDEVIVLFEKSNKFIAEITAFLTRSDKDTNLPVTSFPIKLTSFSVLKNIY